LSHLGSGRHAAATGRDWLRGKLMEPLCALG